MFGLTRRQAYFPCRVEALIGRGDITSAALGSQHTLFLDSKGTVFSCGENKEVSLCAWTAYHVLSLLVTPAATFTHAYSAWIRLAQQQCLHLANTLTYHEALHVHVLL